MASRPSRSLAFHMKFKSGTFHHLTAAGSVRFGGKGIDRVVFTLPVDISTGFVDRLWDDHRSGGFESFRTTAGFSGHRLELYRFPNRSVLSADVTPALLFGADSNIAVPDDDSLAVLASCVWEVIQDLQQLRPLCPPADMKLTRIDLTRDLIVPPGVDIGQLIEGFGGHVPKYSRKKTLYSSADGRAETLHLGNNSRSVRICDKHRQTGNPKATGIIRWEGQLRRDPLARICAGRVGNATPTVLEDARREMWQWSGMNNTITTGAHAAQNLRQLIEEKAIRASQMWSLVGGVLLDFEGATQRTRQRHMKSLRDLGISMDTVRSLASCQMVSYRADYKTGRITGVCLP